jgi:hypothetical protein
MMIGKVSLKTIIVMVILLLVGVLTFLGINAAKTYLSGAAAGTEPKSVVPAPGEDGKSAQISWTTDKETQSVVEYGTIPSSLLLRSVESEATTTHRVGITPLKPSTTYYYRIRVGDEVFDNSGIPYSFKTKSASAEIAPTAKPTVPPVVLAPTVPVASGAATICNRTTDYNSDGVVNSFDFIKCINSGGKPEVVPECASGVDYDGNGIINSLDRIKCLQKAN